MDLPCSSKDQTFTRYEPPTGAPPVIRTAPDGHRIIYVTPIEEIKIEEGEDDDFTIHTINRKDEENIDDNIATDDNVKTQPGFQSHPNEVALQQIRKEDFQDHGSLENNCTVPMSPSCTSIGSFHSILSIDSLEHLSEKARRKVIAKRLKNAKKLEKHRLKAERKIEKAKSKSLKNNTKKENRQLKKAHKRSLKAIIKVPKQKPDEIHEASIAKPVEEGPLVLLNPIRPGDKPLNRSPMECPFSDSSSDEVNSSDDEVNVNDDNAKGDKHEKKRLEMRKEELKNLKKLQKIREADLKKKIKQQKKLPAAIRGPEFDNGEHLNNIEPQKSDLKRLKSEQKQKAKELKSLEEQKAKEVKNKLKNLKTEMKQSKKEDKEQAKLQKQLEKEEKLLQKKELKLAEKEKKIESGGKNKSEDGKKKKSKEAKEVKVKSKPKNDDDLLDKHLLKMKSLQDHLAQKEREIAEKLQEKKKKENSQDKIKKSVDSEHKVKLDELKEQQKLKEKEHKQRLDDLKNVHKEKAAETSAHQKETAIRELQEKKRLEKELQVKKKQEKIKIMQESKDKKDRLNELKLLQKEEEARTKEKQKEIEELEKEQQKLADLEKKQKREEEKLIIAMAKKELKTNKNKVKEKKQRQDDITKDLEKEIEKMETEEAKEAEVEIESLKEKGELIEQAFDTERKKNLCYLKEQHDRLDAEAVQAGLEAEFLDRAEEKRDRETLEQLKRDGTINSVELEKENDNEIKKLRQQQNNDEEVAKKQQKELEELEKEEKRIEEAEKKETKSLEKQRLADDKKVAKEKAKELKKMQEKTRKEAKEKAKEIECREKEKGKQAAKEFERLKKMGKIREKQVHKDLKAKAKRLKERKKELEHEAKVRMQKAKEIEREVQKDAVTIVKQLKKEKRIAEKPAALEKKEKLKKLKQQKEKEIEKNTKLEKEMNDIKTQEEEIALKEQQNDREEEELKLKMKQIENAKQVQKQQRKECEQRKSAIEDLQIETKELDTKIEVAGDVIQNTCEVIEDEQEEGEQVEVVNSRSCSEAAKVSKEVVSKITNIIDGASSTEESEDEILISVSKTTSQTVIQKTCKVVEDEQEEEGENVVINSRSRSSAGKVSKNVVSKISNIIDGASSVDESEDEILVRASTSSGQLHDKLSDSIESDGTTVRAVTVGREDPKTESSETIPESNEDTDGDISDFEESEDEEEYLSQSRKFDQQKVKDEKKKLAKQDKELKKKLKEENKKLKKEGSKIKKMEKQRVKDIKKKQKEKEKEAKQKLQNKKRERKQKEIGNKILELQSSHKVNRKKIEKEYDSEIDDESENDIDSISSASEYEASSTSPIVNRKGKQNLSDADQIIRDTIKSKAVDNQFVLNQKLDEVKLRKKLEKQKKKFDKILAKQNEKEREKFRKKVKQEMKSEQKDNMKQQLKFQNKEQKEMSTVIKLIGSLNGKKNIGKLIEDEVNNMISDVTPNSTSRMNDFESIINQAGYDDVTKEVIRKNILKKYKTIDDVTLKLRNEVQVLKYALESCQSKSSSQLCEYASKLEVAECQVTELKQHIKELKPFKKDNINLLDRVQTLEYQLHLKENISIEKFEQLSKRIRHLCKRIYTFQVERIELFKELHCYREDLQKMRFEKNKIQNQLDNDELKVKNIDERIEDYQERILQLQLLLEKNDKTAIKEKKRIVTNFNDLIEKDGTTAGDILFLKRNIVELERQIIKYQTHINACETLEQQKAQIDFMTLDMAKSMQQMVMEGQQAHQQEKVSFIETQNQCDRMQSNRHKENIMESRLRSEELLNLTAEAGDFKEQIQNHNFQIEQKRVMIKRLKEMTNEKRSCEFCLRSTGSADLNSNNMKRKSASEKKDDDCLKDFQIRELQRQLEDMKTKNTDLSQFKTLLENENENLKSKVAEVSGENDNVKNKYKKKIEKLTKKFQTFKKTVNTLVLNQEVADGCDSSDDEMATRLDMMITNATTSLQQKYNMFPLICETIQESNEKKTKESFKRLKEEMMLKSQKVVCHEMCTQTDVITEPMNCIIDKTILRHISTQTITQVESNNASDNNVSMETQTDDDLDDQICLKCNVDLNEMECQTELAGIDRTVEYIDCSSPKVQYIKSCIKRPVSPAGVVFKDPISMSNDDSETDDFSDSGVNSVNVTTTYGPDSPSSSESDLLESYSGKLNQKQRTVIENTSIFKSDLTGVEESFPGTKIEFPEVVNITSAKKDYLPQVKDNLTEIKLDSFPIKETTTNLTAVRESYQKDAPLKTPRAKTFNELFGIQTDNNVVDTNRRTITSNDDNNIVNTNRRMTTNNGDKIANEPSRNSNVKKGRSRDNENKNELNGKNFEDESRSHSNSLDTNSSDKICIGEDIVPVRTAKSGRRSSLGSKSTIDEINELKKYADDAKPKPRQYYVGIELEHVQTEDEKKLIEKIMKEPLPDPFQDLDYFKKKY